MNTILISYNGIDIRKDSRNRVCLNDLWYAVGRPGNKDPRKWRTFVSSKELITHYETVLKKHGLQSEPSKTPDGSIICSIGGAAGGTYAIRELALAYAGYLDVQLQALIYQAFLDKVDGVRATMDIPMLMIKTFAGSAKDARRATVVLEEHDASYWRGYAEALEKMCLQLAERRFAV